MTTTSQLHDEARAYYELCDRARALGIPTSLDDDPCAPQTVGELAAAVAAAAALAAITSALPFGA